MIHTIAVSQKTTISLIFYGHSRKEEEEEGAWINKLDAFGSRTHTLKHKMDLALAAAFNSF